MPFSYFPPQPENVWGNLDGNINLQTDLIDLINGKIGNAKAKTNLIINPSFKIWQRVANQLEIVTRERTANTSTLETDAEHGYQTGDIVQITEMDDISYNYPSGTAITVVDGTHFSYSNTGSNESVTAESNGEALLTSRVSMNPLDGEIAADRWVFINENSEIVVAPTSNSEGVSVATNNTNKIGFLQVIRSKYLADIVGNTFSASIELKSSESAVANLAILSWTGTADATNNDAVGTWNSDGVNPTLFANWAFEGIADSITLDSDLQQIKLENINIADAGAKNLALFIWFDELTSSEIITAKNAQLVHSPATGDFEPNSYEYDLEECSKFYQKSYTLLSPPHTVSDVGKMIFPTSYGTGNGSSYGTIQINTMYNIPTVKLISHGNSPVLGKWKVSTGTNVAVSTIDISEKSFSVKNDAGFTISTSFIAGHYVCESEI